MKKSKGICKGTSKVSLSSETPFTITFIKRTQQEVVKAHYISLATPSLKHISNENSTEWSIFQAVCNYK